MSLNAFKSSVTNPGKKLEAFFRGLRPFVFPRHRRAFNALVARGLGQRVPCEPVVCCDLSDTRMDAVGGRYYFALVDDLIRAGYFPVFVAHRATLSTFGTSRLKSLLLTRRLGVVASLDELDEPFVMITDTARPAPARVRQVIRMDYKKRLAKGPAEITFPVFMHPQIMSGAQLPLAHAEAGGRTARIFFGGNTDPGKYDKNQINEVYGMMTRRQMLAVAVNEIGGDVHRPASAARWLASSEVYSFVLCESQVCPVPQTDWLTALTKADFFLACPGVGMPLCHNIAEALAAGAIPILQYANYLTPPLEDGVNCLAFSDEVSLRATVKKAVGMNPAEITRLRANVQAYYKAFLAPGRFSGMLLNGNPHSEKTLLLNAYRVRR